jgi:hypothetical protein
MMRTTLWVVFFAIVIDITINSIFTIPYPYSRGEQLANYFEYGRSVESKIVRAVADNDSDAHVSSKIGWFKSRDEIRELTDARESSVNTYIYGMSFSSHIGVILAKIDKSLNIKLFDGPGAPLNHSYAYYESTRPHEKGDIVILGILASSLPLINTMSHMTSSFESPSPHFYPRYRLDDNNNLVKDEIDIKSLSDLRAALNDAEIWRGVKEGLARNDSFHDPFVFERSVLDHSVYFRLIKRAWGQRSLAQNFNRYHDRNGFKNNERMVEVAQRLVSDFVDNVRSDGAIPYLLLFNDRGYDDHLYQMLKSVLNNKDIPYYSTHQRFPATNLANFIPDGHFTPVIDVEIARDVQRQLQEIMGQDN